MVSDRRERTGDVYLLPSCPFPRGIERHDTNKKRRELSDGERVEIDGAHLWVSTTTVKVIL